MKEFFLPIGRKKLNYDMRLDLFAAFLSSLVYRGILNVAQI